MLKFGIISIYISIHVVSARTVRKIFEEAYTKLYNLSVEEYKVAKAEC